MAAGNGEDADAKGIDATAGSAERRARTGRRAGTGSGAGGRECGSVTGEMEHTEARELLELAAVEPDGFERLAAGDTAEAAALAGHLAGCDRSEEHTSELQ